jgi:signal transduction histidine kinase
MRTLSDSPPQAQVSPLHEKLATAAQRTFAETPVVVDVDHTGSPRSYAPSVEAEILAIASEAMTNAHNHSACSTITIHCDYTSRSVRVHVRDDGLGFDPESATPSGHWGLVGMRERATLIGATFSIASAPGSGTDVSIVAPENNSRRPWTSWIQSRVLERRY